MRVKLEREVETLENTRTLLQKLLSNAKAEKENCLNENAKLRKEISELISKKVEKEIKLEKEICRLRDQLWERGIPREKHAIDDDRQQKDMILRVEGHWLINQNPSGKINKRTITDVLGENWKKWF